MISMEDSSRTVLHDFHRASRKAEESALRRFQASSWLESFIGPQGLSAQPSEHEFLSCLRNGLVLCKVINKVQPGIVLKVIEGHSNASSPAYQYFENVRNFLVAVEELNIPAFEASDLERESLDAGSTDKIVDCILSLKSYHEWKEWGGESGGANGSSKHLRSPILLRSASRNQSRVTPTNSAGPCRNLDMANGIENTPLKENENGKLEDSVVGAFVQCLLDSKENIDHKILASFRNGTKDSAKVFRKIMSSCLQGHQLGQFPELKSMLKDPLQEDNKSAPVLTESLSETTTCKMLSCLKRGNCNHRKILEVQTKDLLDLKMLLSRTKNEFEVLQSQLQNDLLELGGKVREISFAALGYQRVIKENRDLYNMVQDLKGTIRVYCRIRPVFATETRNTIDHIGDDGSLVVVDPLRPHKDARKVFQFNRVFCPTSSQDEVYKETQPLIRSVMDGFNVCIFAYGQTGSGKTHTMCGPSNGYSEGMGINYLALNDLFEITCTRRDIVNYEIFVQMVEIYNEQVRDLLTEDCSTAKLEIRNCTNNGGLTLPDATLHVVKSSMDVLNLMKHGEINRRVSSTAINHQSSRSHSVVTVHVHGKDISGNILRSCLHLVDLAGSERVDKSEVTGDRLKEAQYINKSLSCLGDVITALAQKNSHIPYRNSKLTQLLQYSLGGHAKTLMFAHVNPEADSYGETVSTLKFAQRVSTVELGAAHRNKESHEVRELKEQVETLKKALASKGPQDIKSPREKVKTTSDRTPPRPRRLSIENRTPPRSRRLSIENSAAKTLKVAKTPFVDIIPSRPRRLSLGPSKDVSTNEVSSYSTNGEASSSSRNHSEASSVTRVHRHTAPRSPISVSQSRIVGIECRMRTRGVQLPKTPPPEVKVVEAVTPSESQTAAGTTSKTKKGSHIRRSLHTIGKLITPSDKRTHQHPAANADDNARTLRRQSLTLGGRSTEPCSTVRRNAKTPPPAHPWSKGSRQWL